MDSPHYQLDEDIKDLIRQGCSTNQVLQEISSQYSASATEAAQLLRRIQRIERDIRGFKR
ncbi:hypothetical protein ACQ4M3_40575 [Leptolyngbya sp. AN03gr2]|uniref:hypothetical protein n=1 Tax=unclassified Leptolyngbya TaxID=2650499 RepID=UPI003D3116AD